MRAWGRLPRMFRKHLEPHEADHVESAVEALGRLERDGLLSRLHMGDILAIIANDIVDHQRAREACADETPTESPATCETCVS